MHEKKPLYRKVNTRTRGVVHGGGDYKWSRNSKTEKASDAARGSMHAGRQNGFDYTPLFKFLQSKVGENWDKVHSEAMSRLDREEPIWWMVARSPAEEKSSVLMGESSYYSGLKIDGDNRLALVDPELRNEDLKPRCPCCTHTFNGAPFVRKFEGY